MRQAPTPNVQECSLLASDAHGRRVREAAARRVDGPYPQRNLHHVGGLHSAKNVLSVKPRDGLALAPNEAVNESTVVVDARVSFIGPGRLRYGDGGSCPVSPLRGAGRL